MTYREKINWVEQDVMNCPQPEKCNCKKMLECPPEYGYLGSD